MTPQEFTAFYNEHFGKLVFWIQSMTHSRPSAEDIAADALGLAWEKRGDVREFKAWVYTVAYNKAKEIFRSNSYKQTEPLLDDHNERPDTRDFTVELERFMEAQQVAQALERLSAPLHSALRLHVEGVPMKAAARIMRVPFSTVGTRVFEAKRKARELCAV